jgi:hypothetical protein
MMNKIRIKQSLLFLIGFANYQAVVAATNNESATEQQKIAKERKDDYLLQNDSSILLEEQRIALLKQSYISPYNYLQNPIPLNMGLSAFNDESAGAFSVGTSMILGANIPLSEQNKAINTNIVQLWGQSARLNGVSMGIGATAVLNFTQIGQPNTFSTTAVFSPSQAYLNYQYSNKLDITAGNILITTPWVSSFGSDPGATYAMGNNPYQGFLVNIQALPSVLLTGFYAWSYMQYPNNWFYPQTFYNTAGGVLSNIGQTTTNGPSGLGLSWNPLTAYSGSLWLYNFADYASMVYVDNNYSFPLNSFASIDLDFQGFMQSSSGAAITTQINLPGQNTTAGVVSSNGIGGKVALNLGDNTSSFSYNNIFGNSGSFLNGGMLTPYTYGMEIDPLYTTPALTSLAELGSGFAYTLRNSTTFLEKALKFSLSFSQFFVNQVYATQANLVTEYDGAILYQIPKTNMNLWSRLVYVDQGNNYGGSMWQPRVIFNWFY